MAAAKAALGYNVVEFVITGGKFLIRKQIQLTEEQSRALKKMASSRHLSVAELVRQGVDVVLRSNIGIDASEKRKRALAIVGKYRSGKRDNSKRHDKHFAEVCTK